MKVTTLGIDLAKSTFDLPVPFTKLIHWGAFKGKLGEPNFRYLQGGDPFARNCFDDCAANCRGTLSLSRTSSISSKMRSGTMTFINRIEDFPNVVIHFYDGIGKVAEACLARESGVRQRREVHERERHIRVRRLAGADAALHEVYGPPGNLGIYQASLVEVVNGNYPALFPLCPSMICSKGCPRLVPLARRARTPHLLSVECRTIRRGEEPRQLCMQPVGEVDGSRPPPL